MSKFNLKKTIMAAVIVASSGANVFGTDGLVLDAVDGLNVAQPAFIKHLSDLMTHGETLTKEVRALRKDLTSAIADKDNAETDLKRASSKILAAQTAQATAEAEVLRLTKELTVLTSGTSASAAEISTLKGELLKAEAEKKNAEALLVTETQAKDAAESKVSQLTADISTLQSELSKLDAEKKNAEALLVTETQAKVDAELKVSQLTAEISTLQSDLLVMTRDRDAKAAELILAISGKSGSDADVVRLASELAVMTQDRDAKALELVAMTSQRDNARDDLATANSNLDRALQSEHDLNQKVTVLESKLATADLRAQELEKNIASLESSKKSIKKDMEGAMSINARLEEEKALLNDQHQRLKAQMQEMKASLSSHEEEEPDYSSDLAQFEVLRGLLSWDNHGSIAKGELNFVMSQLISILDRTPEKASLGIDSYFSGMYGEMKYMFRDDSDAKAKELFEGFFERIQW